MPTRPDFKYSIRWVLDTPASANSRQTDLSALARRAYGVRDMAYVPLSGFRVGAALLTEDGGAFLGVNVEASNGHSICAERSAIVAAITAGKTSLVAVAAVADTPAPITPCGQCRQLIRDLGPEILVIMGTTRSSTLDVATVNRLLPRGNFKTAA